MPRRSRINPLHSTQRGVARALGMVLLAVGAAFAITGLVDFFGAFSSHGRPTKFWCLFVGLPLVAFGLALLKVGYLGAMTRYVAGETAPVMKDTLGYMVDETDTSVRKMARAVGEGLRGDSPATLACAKCGEANDADARFCDGCGTPLGRTCEGCGSANDGDARFCKQCGRALAAKA